MEFFLLFIFNIFTGAVIYLILSLKIERTSSSYQEQKLKKEMGEIITEFNSTAERNITLLENRINLMKRLLNEKGDFRGIDLVIDDEKIKHVKKHDLKSEKIDSGMQRTSTGILTQNNNTVSQKPPVKNDGNILVGIIDKISNITRDFTASDEADKKNTSDVEIAGKNKKSTDSRIDYIVDSDIKIPVQPVEEKSDYTGSEIHQKEKNEEDIAVLFSNSPDKYSLISDLHKKGYTVDDISRHSGLPAGEVRLVISLNG